MKVDRSVRYVKTTPADSLCPHAEASCLGGLGEANLLGLQGGVPEGEDLDDLVAVPPDGLAELEVKRFSGRRNHGAVRQGHLPGEGSCGAADYGDPVAAPELDRVRVVVHADVGEDPEEL